MADAIEVGYDLGGGLRFVFFFFFFFPLGGLFGLAFRVEFLLAVLGGGSKGSHLGLGSWKTDGNGLRWDTKIFFWGAVGPMKGGGEVWVSPKRGGVGRFRCFKVFNPVSWKTYNCSTQTTGLRHPKAWSKKHRSRLRPFVARPGRCDHFLVEEGLWGMAWSGRCGRVAATEALDPGKLLWSCFIQIIESYKNIAKIMRGRQINLQIGMLFAVSCFSFISPNWLDSFWGHLDGRNSVSLLEREKNK